MLFPSQDKRNVRDKAKDLCVSSEKHIGELGTRYLSTLNRVQDSRQSLIHRDRRVKASRCMLRPLLRCGVRCVGVEEISNPFPGRIHIMYARELVEKVPCRRMNLRAYLEVWVIFPYLCTRKRNERPCGDAGSLTLRDL